MSPHTFNLQFGSLNKNNIDACIQQYVHGLKSIEVSFTPAEYSMYTFFQYLKRERGNFGNYSGITIFEAANRTFSDLVLLATVKRLLEEPVLSGRELPFEEYTVQFSNSSGYDITANKADVTLLGEAFNVADSFFHSKLSHTKKKLIKANSDFKLIAFNSDALGKRSSYKENSSQAGNNIEYLPVDINELIS